MTDLFSIRGRINRARYFTVMALANLAVFIVAFATSGHQSVAAAALLVVCSLAAEAVIVCHAIRRLHDLGRPGSHFWLLLIPFYGVYIAFLLLFKKGTDETNGYGPDPLDRVAAFASA